MSREEAWIENRADEIYAMWVEAYPVMRRNEDTLNALAVSEAEAEFKDMCDEAAVDRAEARAEMQEREDERWADCV